MTVATTTLGERGILRLPASVRGEAGFDKGDELIAIVAGPGRVVLTTRTAIQDEVWAAAPSDADATNMRAERAADNAAVEAKQRRLAAQQAATSQAKSDQAGAELLSRFGA